MRSTGECWFEAERRGFLLWIRESVKHNDSRCGPAMDNPTTREFNAKAVAYEANRLAPWYLAQSDYVLEHLSLAPTDSVLDIGCGTGYLLRQVARACPGVTGIGIDIAPRMIQVARAKAAAEALSNLTFVHSDWERLTDQARTVIGRESVSWAVCTSVFHYFSAPGSATRAVHGVLQPGGTLLILERARERSLLTLLWHYLHLFLLRDNVRFYSSAEIVRIVEEAGFRDVRVVSRLRRILWKNKLYTSLALVRGTKYSQCEQTDAK